MITVGILSDNHGDWPPRIAESLAGVDAIIHAGDIGPYKLVLDMEGIAPTTAVLGNTDGDLPINETAVTTLGEKKFLVQHIVNPHRLQAPLRERLKHVQPDVVIFGHTHQPFCETL
ncbi:MAG: metallophosphoesterase family protein, partial [Verrucomicrobiota bacterium]|nr:metallophosphoesterase family protein [Verrucomicrobiota bacterium]